MGIPLGSNFDLTAGLPLDSRVVAADITARNAISSVARFVGLEVYVESENKKYRLEGGILDGNWTEMGSLEVNMGASTRIPYMNGAGTNFLYSAGLVFDGTTFEVTEIQLSTGTIVDTIETTLTNDNDHLPTSGAVWAALAGLTSMSWNGSTANAVGTYGGVNTIDAEQYLIYDAGILTVGGGEGTSELRLAHSASAYSWIWQAQGDSGLVLSHYTDNFIAFATPTILIYQNVDIDGSITLGSGSTVDTIETVLTDDDTHLPTSGAVVDAIAAVPTQILNLGTAGQVPYMNGLGDDFVYTGITMVTGVLEVPGGMAVSSLSLTTSPIEAIMMAQGTGSGRFLTDANLTFNTTQEALTIGGGAASSNLIMDYSGSSQPYEMTATSTFLHFHEYSTTIMTLSTSGIALRTGERVDTIEASLTDDDTHIATSGAIFGALAAQAVTYGGLEQIPYVDLGLNGFQYTAGFNFTGANLNVPGLANVDGIQLDIAYVSPDAGLEGLLTWNPTDYTLNIGTGLGTTLQVGQEDLIMIYNNTAGNLSDGKVVQIGGGATSTFPWAEYAQADVFENCDRILAVMTGTVTPGNIGFATRRGKVRGVNTTVYGYGKLYLSPTSPGDVTTTEPAFPNYRFEIGGVTFLGVLDGVLDIFVSGDVHDTVENFWNGTIRESFAFTVTESGGVVTGHLNDTEGNNSLTYLFQDGFYLADTTSSIDVVLTTGTDTVPVTNYVYILESTKALTISTTSWPVVQHIRVAQIVLQSAATVGLDGGALRNQNWNDHLVDTTGQGHLSHIGAKLRNFESQWSTGVQASHTHTPGTPDSITVQTTSGSVYQLHLQAFPAFDTSGSDVFHVVNHNLTPYIEYTDIYQIQADANNVTLNNSSYSIVLWGVVNSAGEVCHLFMNLPTGNYSYVAPDNAVQDANNYAVYDIPREFQGVGFLIARYVIQLKNNDCDVYLTEDLRGKIPNTTAGGGGGGGGGATSFTGLTDTPATYIGEALKLPQVNAGETALEFTNSPTVATLYVASASAYIDAALGEIRFTDPTNGTVLLSSLISTLTVGTTTQVAFANVAGNDLEYSDDFTFNDAQDNLQIGGTLTSSVFGLNYSGASYPYEFTATATDLLLHEYSTDILSMNTAGIALRFGARVDSIQTILVSDDTQIATAKAIIDYVTTEAYVHPNHTGQVTSVGDGAQALDHSAVDGQTAHPGLIGSETMLMEDSDVLYSIAMAQLETYLNVNLAFNLYIHPNHTGHVTSTGDGATVLTIAAITGQPELTAGIASTDELLINDGGVLKRVDMTFVEAYMQSNLSFNNYSHPNHSGQVTSVGDGAQTLTVAAINDWTTPASFVGGENFLVEFSGTLYEMPWTLIGNYLDTQYNDYSHPNHTGEVTSSGDGAQTVGVTAISNRSYVPSADGSEDFLVKQGSGLWKLSMTQFETYLNANLSFGTSDVSLNGSTANGVATYGGTNTLDIESTFTYTGASGILRIGGGASTSKLSMYTTATYNWWMEADSSLFITWGYYTSTYLTLTSGGLTHSGSMRGTTNLYAGDNTTAYNSAFVDNSIVVATTATATRSGIELVGNQTADTSVGTLSWHNTQATQADKRVAQIDGGRSNGNDGGYLRMYTSTTSTTLQERFNIDNTGAVRIGYGNTSAALVTVHSTSNRIAAELGYHASTVGMYFSGTTKYNVEGILFRPYSYQTIDYTLLYHYGGDYGGMFHRQGSSFSDLRVDYNYLQWGIGTTSTAWRMAVRFTEGYIQVKGKTTAYLYLDSFSGSYDTAIWFRESSTAKAIMGYDTGINAFQIHTGTAFTSLAAADFSITDAGEIYMGNLDVASNTNYLRHNTTTGEVTYYSSDRRLKKNIREFDVDALEQLSKFSPKTFEWIAENDDKTSNGWIAQEGLEHIDNMFPMVEKTGLYSISEGEILPYYHKALMQLKARVEELESQLAEK